MERRYNVTAEATIHAPIEKIWDVMIQTEKYPIWNSFVRKIKTNSGEPVVGTKMKFEVVFYDGKTARSGELVKKYLPPHPNNGHREAEWVYDFTGFLHVIGMVRASRIQKLVQQKDGSIYYFTEEKFSGWGKRFLPLTKVKAGFISMAADLKTYCEKL